MSLRKENNVNNWLVLFFKWGLPFTNLYVNSSNKWNKSLSKVWWKNSFNALLINKNALLIFYVCRYTMYIFGNKNNQHYILKTLFTNSTQTMYWNPVKFYLKYLKFCRSKKNVKERGSFSFFSIFFFHLYSLN